MFLTIGADAEPDSGSGFGWFTYAKNLHNKQRSVCVKRRSPRKDRWFLDFGASVWRHSIVHEQLARRLGWIMWPGGGGVPCRRMYRYVSVFFK